MATSREANSEFAPSGDWAAEALFEEIQSRGLTPKLVAIVAGNKDGFPEFSTMLNKAKPIMRELLSGASNQGSIEEGAKVPVDKLSRVIASVEDNSNLPLFIRSLADLVEERIKSNNNLAIASVGNDLKPSIKQGIKRSMDEDQNISQYKPSAKQDNKAVTVKEEDFIPLGPPTKKPFVRPNKINDDPEVLRSLLSVHYAVLVSGIPIKHEWLSNVKGMLTCNFVHANNDGYYGFFGGNDYGKFRANNSFERCSTEGSVFCPPGQGQAPINFNIKFLERGTAEEE